MTIEQYALVAYVISALLIAVVSNFGGDSDN